MEGETSSRTHRRSRKRHRGSKERPSKRRRSSSRHRGSSSRSRHSTPGTDRRGASASSTATVLSAGFAQLAETLSSIMQSGSRTSNHFLSAKFLPEFDSEASKFDVDDWLEKVNNCATVYNWEDKTKLFFAVCKLRGNAKIWYDELPNPPLTWEVFSRMITRQFTGELGFGKLLKEAVLYTSTPGQDLKTYCFLKVGKSNRLKLDLSEDKLVDFVAEGIHDDRIRATILASRCKSLADLNNLLGIFDTSDSKTKDSKNVKRFTRRETTNNKHSDREKTNSCYSCGKTGHIRRNCPEQSKYGKKEENRDEKKDGNRITCGYCHKTGHTEERCYSKRKEKETVKRSCLMIDESLQSLEDENDDKSIKRPLKTCTINGVNKQCTVDLGSDSSLIREGVARSLALKFSPTNTILAGFNNSSVRASYRAKY